MNDIEMMGDIIGRTERGPFQDKTEQKQTRKMTSKLLLKKDLGFASVLAVS